MSDFKSFQNQYRKPQPGQASSTDPQRGRDTSGNSEKIPFDQKTVMNFAKQYENSSEQEVLSDLLKTAKQGKQDGTFDIGQMEQFASTLSGALNDQQKQRLADVMKMLKDT